MKIVCYIFHEGNLKSFKVDNLPARVSKPKIMDVKIKNGEEMIDATIEMVDGVMVVSPKVEKFEPKDGDVVTTEGGRQVFINKKYIEKGCGYAYIGWNFGNDEEFIEGEWAYSRFATEEERKKLFDKLKEKGYEWDAEKKEVVKIKWKPVLGEVYFGIEFVDHEFRYADWNWKNSTYEIEAYERGWCFKTKEECQEFCNRLNNAINQVKP